MEKPCYVIYVDCDNFFPLWTHWDGIVIAWAMHWSYKGRSGASTGVAPDWTYKVLYFQRVLEYNCWTFRYYTKELWVVLFVEPTSHSYPIQSLAIAIRHQLQVVSHCMHALHDEISDQAFSVPTICKWRSLAGNEASLWNMNFRTTIAYKLEIQLRLFYTSFGATCSCLCACGVHNYIDLHWY